MAQELQEESNLEKIVEKTYGNYAKVKRSYKKIVKENPRLDITEIYNRILSDLKWDNQKRPTVRQLVNRFKKEISNERKEKPKN